MDCFHTTSRTLGRVIDRLGRDMLMERCDHCGENANGPGVWVPRAVVYDVSVLPIFKDNRTMPEKREATEALF